MSTYTQRIAMLRSIIRWSTGALVTAGMIGGCVGLVPALTGNFAAMGMTCFLSAFIGLKIALPPICPDEDWVCIGSHKHRDREVEASRPAVRPETAVAPQREPVARPHPPLEVLPVHRNRSAPAPVNRVHMQDYLRKWRAHDTLLWNVLHPNGRHEHKAKKMSHN
jgi:hypothetical protein